MTNLKCFFDDATNTISHVVWDESSGKAAIIDSVLDFDQASGGTSTHSADELLSFIMGGGLKLEYILETHVHADHLTASKYLQGELGGKTAISENIRGVQEIFAGVFNEDLDEIQAQGKFDIYLKDGDELALGDLTIKAIATPGHTPACMTFVIGDAAFVGDTLFMPDSGSARCDFPEGCPKQLFNSIKKLFGLPDETRLFMCHDYGAGGARDCAWQTTVGEEKAKNIHVGGDKTEADFVKMRTERDATLSMPKLLLPSVQVNMRAGNFPADEKNGISYLKLPLNYFD
ncbi:MAG: MBL fold metallo-hydrolase [Sphingomonadales bacterium]